MNPRLSRALIALYPRPWRMRYEEEFAALLETEPAAAATLLNIALWAFRERTRSSMEEVMTPRRGLTLMVYAYLASIVAGVNLYWTVDDTPLIPAMHASGAMFAFWRMVAWGSFIALAAAVGGAVPPLIGMIRFAIANRRYDILGRLAFPPAALAALVIWIGLVASRTHWAPTPWDITGVWVAPADWPSLSVRWMFGSVTTVLLAAGSIGSALALKQAIEWSELSPSTFVRLALFVLAGSIVLMAVGAAGWGFVAELYAPAVFHSRAGGIFGSPSILSWIASVILFSGAAAVALRGARGWTMA